MKNLNLLIWLTQLGLSTALPPAAFCILGVLLHRHRGWGIWTVWAGIVLGLICAVRGFRHSLKLMERMAEAAPQGKPSASFNDHQ